jgi:hypothetical protein
MHNMLAPSLQQAPPTRLEGSCWALQMYGVPLCVSTLCNTSCPQNPGCKVTGQKQGMRGQTHCRGSYRTACEARCSAGGFTGTKMGSLTRCMAPLGSLVSTASH